MKIPPDEVDELRALKDKVDALRARVPTDDHLWKLHELVEGMWRWVIDLDAEIDDLNSRIRHIERKLGL